MTLHSLFSKHIKTLLQPRKVVSPERQRAIDLIAAIDAGGIPMNPVRLNDIGRKLGLEVPMTAPMEETIERIRTSLKNKAC